MSNDHVFERIAWPVSASAWAFASGGVFAYICMCAAALYVMSVICEVILIK